MSTQATIREMKALFQKYGLEVIDSAQNKHIRFRLRAKNGVEFGFTAPVSPSDSRCGMANQERDLKRILRERGALC